MDKVAEHDTKNLFMDVQAVLCTVITVLLAGGALNLYLDSAAKQTKGVRFLPGRAKLTG